MNLFPSVQESSNTRALDWTLFLTRFFSSAVLLYISLGGLLYYREFLYNVAFLTLPLPVGIGILLFQIFLALLLLLGWFTRFCGGACIVCAAGAGFIFLGADFNKIYVALVLLEISALLPALLLGGGRYSVDFFRARRRGATFFGG